LPYIHLCWSVFEYYVELALKMLNALKGGKPTTDKGNANQDGPGNE